MTETSTKQTETGATILVCQCQGTAFTPEKTTKTAVTLKCRKCGERISVKGGVAALDFLSTEKGRVAVKDIVNLAVRDLTIRPDPSAKPGRVSPPKTTTERGYRLLKFRVLNDQYEVVSRALEAVRVLNLGDERFRAHQWQGASLEAICADFLAGVDPRVLNVVDTIEEAFQQSAATAQAERGRELSKRHLRRMRKQIMDDLVEETFSKRGPIVVKNRNDEEDSEESSEEDLPEKKPTPLPRTASTEDAVPDADRLYEAVESVLKEHANDHDGEDPPFQYYCEGRGRLTEQLQEIWDNGGGYMLKAIGDRRTENLQKTVPVVYFWINAEDEDDVLDFSLAYWEMFEDALDQAKVEVVELLPVNYDIMEHWEKPYVADRREQL